MFIRAIQTFCIVSELKYTTKKYIKECTATLWHHHNAYLGYSVFFSPSHNIAKVFAAILLLLFFLLHLKNFFSQICLLSIGSVKNDFSIPNGIQSQWRSYCLVHLFYWGVSFLWEILYSGMEKHKTKISLYYTPTVYIFLSFFSFWVVVQFSVSILTICKIQSATMLTVWWNNMLCGEVSSCEI